MGRVRKAVWEAARGFTRRVPHRPEGVPVRDSPLPHLGQVWLRSWLRRTRARGALG